MTIYNYNRGQLSISKPYIKPTKLNNVHKLINSELAHCLLITISALTFAAAYYNII